MVEMVGDPIFAHFHRDGFFRHAKGPAEATTLVFSIQLDKLQPLDQVQQLPGLGEGGRHEFRHLRQLEPALSMTALMQPDLMGERSIQRVDLEHICEEFYEFVYLPGDVTSGIMQMFFDMQHAASGRGNDIIECLKIFDEQVVAAFSEMFETGVGHWLATAGLVGRIDHLATEFFQQLEGGDANLRVELVDITGYK